MDGWELGLLLQTGICKLTVIFSLLLFWMGSCIGCVLHTLLRHSGCPLCPGLDENWDEMGIVSEMNIPKIGQ